MAKIDDEIKTKFENDKHRFITNLIYTSNWVNSIANELFKSFGLSQEQFNILRILRGAKDWKTMNDIKSLMIHKTPNTTRLSDKLLHKELVERRRSESDRRIVYLKISEKGSQLLKEIDEYEENKKTFQFLENITDEEAAQFSELLDRLREKYP
ncbi:MarR family winged helix-turn-helix transcriptional regulator [Flammeovirga pacifica]|uniref:MarR family transcriptional regulator n=1 Tax=Flammeovirga pacifica TaxID=915059 RepID=A0A1S1Z097_FLAPC|nr:MarR family transcriptional regulator [Flammeovirga pacifica]OHX66686.1 MarR family transcriptional regulator [Flammeovirga pacifica]